MGNMRLARAYNKRPAKTHNHLPWSSSTHNTFLFMGYNANPYYLFWSTSTTITHLWSWVMVPSLTFCVGSSTPITHLCFWFIVPTFTTSWGVVAPPSYIFGYWVWCWFHTLILIIEHDQGWKWWHSYLLKLLNFIIQKAAAPKNGVEFCQKVHWGYQM